jgi:hypothetical protein
MVTFNGDTAFFKSYNNILHYIFGLGFFCNGWQLPMQSVPITTDVVSLNLDQGEVYNIIW